jgi:hypothetical protein
LTIPAPPHFLDVGWGPLACIFVYAEPYILFYEHRRFDMELLLPLLLIAGLGFLFLDDGEPTENSGTAGDGDEGEHPTRA